MTPEQHAAGNPHEAAAYPQQQEWLEWLRLSDYNAITVDQYRWVTDKLLRKFPDVGFAEITERHVAAVLMEQPERSRQTRRGTFANWFAWGFRFRLITESPMERVPMYKRKGKPLLDVFTEAEVKVLCALPEPDGTLMAVLLDTGIRKAEARNLTVRRCRLADAELHSPLERFDGQRIGILSTAVGIARLRLHKDDAEGAREVLDSAVAEIHTLHREALIASGYSAESVDAFLGGPQ